ncbi:Phosphoenolpyruvate/pyruvate domain-containing protein [Hortaea werneckii]|uniref:Uncharacterized protein n=2 Tax=Hortaea werneckii TaxID=91943 RepID=A0A3M7J8Q4_HORWE|nr:Phosphoenolpyruvate/pyruvate domain-containing protein [Hortaea werneckii]OTA27919.1 hypothetical protein BTJ68_11545 [Hortaea werneckii EXF-2000]KAI6945205.1 Phosphoenolpyruvate/pyruvate domain-containing protein [Hortaea werneckii]KAI6951238.1 Phosphoenolpyruvate/pyruvate domain-containing protein [Hortaea werneckii]KAI7000056.1 Phosphoenolpyruvate/pyruvate domain-containing protein [Hortaea werneckii]
MDPRQSNQLSGTTRLRQALSDPKNVVVAPGVFDGITSQIAIASGHQCLYMTGAGTSMARLGMADLGLCTFTEMHQNAAMIAAIDPTVPVIADADTGYGGPINISRTVKAYAQAGIAGLHIEDQVQTKRCGHLSGKKLVSREEFANRLRAACKARDESGSDIVIIARTDALAGKDPAGNTGFDEAVKRLSMAVEIGVDALFFEALHSEEECKLAIERLPKVPCLLNMIPGGRTPVMTNQRAAEIGFRIVIWPLMGLEAAIPALQHAYKTLKINGQAPKEAQLGPEGLFEVCGLQKLMEFDASVGGRAYSS